MKKANRENVTTATASVSPQAVKPYATGHVERFRASLGGANVAVPSSAREGRLEGWCTRKALDEVKMVWSLFTFEAMATEICHTRMHVWTCRLPRPRPALGPSVKSEFI
ncbi:unnamed protein product [Protopolystoma xenopodis]|uniref:Uncharacterized protein n=1 Tax=Protopolystoma xenopodis TaxID=117903 RepID=A0A3S5CIJ2_9PLAT|nr:unnamed protein product [Protopolystoma xenopodis]